MIAPEAPPAAGIHEIDFLSWAMMSMPSFFLYEAEPLGGEQGGAIVVASLIFHSRRPADSMPYDELTHLGG